MEPVGDLLALEAGDAELDGPQQRRIDPQARRERLASSLLGRALDGGEDLAGPGREVRAVEAVEPRHRGRDRVLDSLGVNPFWLWLQALIVVFVLAGIVIGAVKLF